VGGRIHIAPLSVNPEHNAETTLAGALVLAWSLRTFSRGRDLIALIPENRLSENHIDMLARAGWRINVVPSIPLPQTRKINIRFQDMLVKLYAFVSHRMMMVFWEVH
jgi:hypothetical protein